MAIVLKHGFMPPLRGGVGLLCCVAAALGAVKPEGWIPVRWEGGPLEIARREADKENTLKAPAREAIARWYEPETLGLLGGTPVNCLLVTFSAGAGEEIEGRQHKLITQYARKAHERGFAVLGIVYPGAQPETAARAAVKAGLDGLVLDGDFPEGFARKIAGTVPVVIPIAKDVAGMRSAKDPLLAITGVRPAARNPADLAIHAGASAEPWIESNIWLVRSFRLDARWRPVWVSQQPDPVSAGDYVRCVADSAVGGGRWMVALDDELRAGLWRKDAGALATWRAIGHYLQFAEEHADWRAFVPYGNLALIVDDKAADRDFAEEYLNLVARKQVPYRLIFRSRLTAASLAGFRAVLAVELAPPTTAERNVLREFAAKGGMVIAGPSWGNPPKDDPYAEVPVGDGRVIVYKEEPPDPESIARDMLELLAPEVMGLSVFNTASGITSAGTADSGRRVLVQLLNYAGAPATRVTVRFNGAFRTARLYTPEEAPVSLPVRIANGRTEVFIPRFAVWGAVLLE